MSGVCGENVSTPLATTTAQSLDGTQRPRNPTIPHTNGNDTATAADATATLHAPFGRRVPGVVVDGRRMMHDHTEPVRQPRAW